MVGAEIKINIADERYSDYNLGHGRMSSILKSTDVTQTKFALYC